MRYLTILALVAVALTGCAGQPAERDEARYLDRFENLSELTTSLLETQPESLIASGDNVCELYAMDLTPREVYEGLKTEVQRQYSGTDEFAAYLIMARTFAEYAAQDLCPEDFGHLRW